MSARVKPKAQPANVPEKTKSAKIVVETPIGKMGQLSRHFLRRVLPLIAMGIVSRLCARWALSPDHAYKIVCSGCALLGLICWGNRPLSDDNLESKRSFYLFGALCSFVSSFVLFYHAGILPRGVFVYFTMALCMVGCVLVALMSAFIGSVIKPTGQHIAIAIALGTPLFATALYGLLGSQDFFTNGVTVSIIASAVNVLFNKKRDSVAIPSMFRSQTNNPLFSQSRPKSGKQE